MKTQLKALRLADALDADATNGDMGRKPDPRAADALLKAREA